MCRQKLKLLRCGQCQQECEEQELHVAVVTQPDQEKHLSTAISQELAHIHSPNPAFCFVCCCSQNDTDEKNEVIAVQAMFQGFSEACQKFGFLETGNDGRFVGFYYAMTQRRTEVLLKYRWFTVNVHGLPEFVQNAFRIRYRYKYRQNLT